MKFAVKFFVCLVAIFAPVFVAGAHEVRHGGIVVHQPQVTVPLPGVKVSAGYMIIMNMGEEADRLVGVETGFAKKSEIHSVEIDDGVAKMRPITNGIEIAPGERVTLKKGGFHLMFMGVAETLEPGNMQGIRLQFEKAGMVEIEAVTIDRTSSEGQGHTGDHSGHGSGHGDESGGTN